MGMMGESFGQEVFKLPQMYKSVLVVVAEKTDEQFEKECCCQIIRGDHLSIQNQFHERMTHLGRPTAKIGIKSGWGWAENCNA